MKEREKTKEEVDRAYGFSRKMGRRFMQTHPRPVYFLDEDDYTQEAMIAWLEKKHIPYRLVDTYRKAAPVGRRDWVKNKENLKLYDPIDIDLISGLVESDQDVEMESETLIRLKQIQDIVNNLIDPRQQLIILMKYVDDKSLTEIAKTLRLSKTYTSKLHQECLEIIKEEVKKSGNS